MKNFKFVAVALLAMSVMMACQTAPVIRETSTEAERGIVETARRGLETVPNDSERIGPKDSAKIEYAKTALELCRDKLAAMEKDNTTCARGMLDTNAKLRSVSADLEKTSEELAQYKSKVRWSFLGEVGSFFKGVAAGVLLSIVAAIALYFTGLFAKGLDAIRSLRP